MRREDTAQLGDNLRVENDSPIDLSDTDRPAERVIRL